MLQDLEYISFNYHNLPSNNILSLQLLTQALCSSTWFFFLVPVLCIIFVMYFTITEAINPTLFNQLIFKEIFKWQKCSNIYPSCPCLVLLCWSTFLPGIIFLQCEEIPLTFAEMQTFRWWILSFGLFEKVLFYFSFERHLYWIRILVSLVP